MPLTPKESLEQGHAAAEQAAVAATAEWWDYAYDLLITYAERHKTFMIEDVILAEGKKYLDCPGDERAWGSVTRAAVKEGILKRHGIGISRIHHGAYKTVWRSNIAPEGVLL